MTSVSVSLLALVLAVLQINVLNALYIPQGLISRFRSLKSVFNRSIILLMALMQPFALTEQGKAPQERITVVSIVGSTVAKFKLRSLVCMRSAFVPFTLLICTF